MKTEYPGDQFSEGVQEFFLLQCPHWLRPPPNLLSKS